MGGVIFIILLMWGIGYFMALLITGGEARRWWTKLLQALLGLVIGLAILGMMYLEQEGDSREYNDGICSICGGEYKFSSAAGRGISRHYYYSCEDCDHTIQVESIQH